MDSSEKEITKLQNSLSLIRKAGGWSTEEFGDMIGVTKQTISNLENKKTPMTKIQYIAIRSVLDYEMKNRPEDKILASAVNLSLNSEDLSNEDVRKAQAFVEGAVRTGLDNDAFAGGLSDMIGLVTANALLAPFAPTIAIGAAGTWLGKIIKSKRNKK